MDFSAPTFFSSAFFSKKKKKKKSVPKSIFYTFQKSPTVFSPSFKNVSWKKNVFLKDALKNVLIHSYTSLTAGSVTFAKETLNE